MPTQWTWPQIHDRGKVVDEELRRVLNKRLSELQRLVRPSAYQVQVTGIRELREAVLNSPDYSVIELVGAGFGDWDLTGTPLTLPNPVTVKGNGIRLVQTTAGQPGVSITSSNVRIENLKVRGKQFAAQSSDENGIEAIGASAAAPLTQIELEACEIDTFGMAGIWLEHVEDFNVRLCRLSDLYYAGVHGLSVIDGDVGQNRIANVVGSPLGYGMTFTRAEVDSLTTKPRSTNVRVHDNLIDGVPNWEGLDTHGGDGVRFIDNTVLNCHHGIVGVRADGAGNVQLYAPIDCDILNNYVDSGVTDGSMDTGIFLVGAGSAGSITEYATGKVNGNTVRGHGDETDNLSGGIVVYFSQAKVTENLCIECSPHSFVAYTTNGGFSIDNNTSIDAWSNTYAGSAAVAVRSTYNDGTVVNNRVVVGSKSATYVNERGLSVDSSTSVDLLVHGNSFDDASTPYSGTANGTRKVWRQQGDVEIGGRVGVINLSSSALVHIDQTSQLSGATQIGLYTDFTGSSASTSLAAMRARIKTEAASFTATTAKGLFIEDASKGASSTITTQIGLDIESQTQGGTNFAIRTGLGKSQFGDTIEQAGTHGELWTRGIATEELTLTGLTTDTSANLLPANSIIDAVVWRITTTITGSALVNFTIGDPTTAARFQAAYTTFTAGQTGVGLQAMQGSVTTDAAGPVQTSAAKVRVTVSAASVSGGVIRLTVFYRQGTAPTS